jgi:hypothetical protein
MTPPRTPNVAHHVVVNAPIERAFDGDAGWPLYLGRYTELMSAEVAK